ncbi:hypothetical protein UFOVP71_338 [uncultured Caudovirales phage]|uniref:Uncharacterized protein n=1 Tax=uncultured Caudovirales phage TaxID=2100421 RepID=A0A6J5TDS0_9CAUD|nr:hypothetical protein UFOVP71_338 [uncultured Caudovirales phage]
MTFLIITFFVLLFVALIVAVARRTPAVIYDDFDDEVVHTTTTTTTTTTNGVVTVGTITRGWENNQPYVFDPVDNSKMYLNDKDDLYEDADGKYWNLI